MKLFCTIMLAMMATTGRLYADDAPAILHKLVPQWQKPPKTTPATGFQEEGLTAVFYEGIPFHGQPTRVFAWYGLPKITTSKKFPAMVLVHGGGGGAFASWVRLWNSRGYAAIAMDVNGNTPPGNYNDWKHDDQGGPMGISVKGNGGLDTTDAPIEDQWNYHAVADVILGHSLIRSFPEVDSDRIGITGISWGGYLTCIVSGLDRRFKFAAPVYGCGFLGDDSCWVPALQGLGKEKADKWLKWWDPSQYLANARLPMLWVDGTNDFAYPMDSLQKSYRLARGPQTLVLRVRMPHGHGGPGENPEEIHAFADQLLMGKPPLAHIKKAGREGDNVWAKYESPTPIVKAELNYTKDSGKWQDRKWETNPAKIDETAHQVSATLPVGTTVYYLNLIDQHELVVSSEHEELAK